MRINRLKRLQQRLSFYVNNFGFRKPYQVLIDGTLCSAALKDQLNITQQLTSYLGENVKLLTTPCAILEIENLGKKLYGAMLILKKFPIHYCQHKNKPVSGSECFLSMVGSSNANRYIIATQDRDLQDKLRLIPGVAIFFFHNKGPTLEAPSKASEKAASEMATNSWGINKYEKEEILKLKDAEGIKSEDNSVPKKKKKKKNPNPLSCKKKQKKTDASTVVPKDAGGRVGKKRNRRGKKLPQHVKEELLRYKSVAENSA